MGVKSPCFKPPAGSKPAGGCPELKRVRNGEKKGGGRDAIKNSNERG